MLLYFAKKNQLKHIVTIKYEYCTFKTYNNVYLNSKEQLIKAYIYKQSMSIVYLNLEI